MEVTVRTFDHFTTSPEPEISDVKIYSWVDDTDKPTILFVPSSATIYAMYSDKLGLVKKLNRFEPYMQLCSDLSEHFNVHLISLSGQTDPKENKEPKHLFNYFQAVKDVKVAVKYIESKFDKIVGAMGFCAGGMELVTTFTDLYREDTPLLFWNAPARVFWIKDYEFFERFFPNLKMDEKLVKSSPEPHTVVPNYKGSILYAYSTNNTLYGVDNISEVKELILQKNKKASAISFNNIGDVPMEIQSESEYNRFIQTIRGWFYKSGSV